MSQQFRSLLAVWFLCAILVGCVERAPDGSNGSSVNSNPIPDAGTDEPDRPDLAIDEFEARRGLLGNVGLWSFYGDELTTRFDNLRPEFPVRFDVDPAGQGAVFDQSSGVLQLKDGAHVSADSPDALIEEIVANDAFSIELWVRLNRGRDQAVLTLPTAEGVALSIHVSDNGARIQFDGETLAADGAFQRGRLVHLVLTYEDNLLAVHVDGVLDDARFANLPAKISDTGSINIGESFSERSPFDGELHLFAIWSRALTEAEVFQHFLVGPRPEGSDLVEQLEPGAGVYVHGRVPASPTQWRSYADTTIEEGSELDPADGTFGVSSEEQALLRFDAVGGAPVERDVVGDFVGIVHSVPQSDGILLSYAAVWKPWDPGAVSWMSWRRDDMWGEPGATAPGDRSETFATIAPIKHQRYIAQIPTALVDYWRVEPVQNGGLVLFFDGGILAGTRQFDSGDAEHSARRPYLVRLAAGGAVPTSLLAAPEALRRENPTSSNDTDLRWAPSAAAEYYDVFANERFIGRTVEPGLFHRNGSRQRTEVRYRVLARDFYGRISAWSEPFVIYSEQ